jgi:hypothetical protein
LAAVASIPTSVILRTVWNDVGEVLVRLRRPFIIALSLVVVLGIVSSVPAISGNPVLSEAFGLISMIAILPFEIAVFRLLILDEAARGYDFAVSTVRFQRMLGWTVAFWVMGLIPTLLSAVFASSGAATAIVGIAMLVLFVIAVVVLLRIVILLPAIAVDAPAVSIGNVFADTSGHGWFILKAYLAVVVPLTLITILAAALAWLGGGSAMFDGSRSAAAVGVNAIFGALGFLAVISLMIVQARLFMRIGDRVNGGAESAGE